LAKNRHSTNYGGLSVIACFANKNKIEDFAVRGSLKHFARRPQQAASQKPRELLAAVLRKLGLL
jgi:hypothetical protein